ncbi:MAG TPA: TatD family hydrolase [Candidatus Kapabacteria bacterium]|nr:TatD family hydrolase [Candidatus Kapabacteria bacterium]
MLFDAHCHLQDPAFDADRDAMLAEARVAGVSHFLVPATDTASFPATIELARSREHVYCALGIHPHSASEWNREVRERIREAVEANEKVVAIGEIGLDYHYDFAPRDVQRKVFAEQIELAIELHKPIVIHTRESEEDVFRIIEEHYGGMERGAAEGAHHAAHQAGQFHCFSLGHEFLHRAISLGFYISYTGNITFKNSALGDSVRDTPLDRLLIETDSPYLAPAPHRGRRNSPAYLPFIARKAAELKGQDLSTIMQHTFDNTLRLFRIVLPASSAMLFAILMLASFGVSRSFAQVQQPAGIQPPDSLLTGDRRKAEELRKKQEEELAKEAEQHRIDSLKAEEKALEEAKAKAREQARQDSIQAERTLAAEEQHALFLQTLQPWKAIGVGFSGGVANLQMAPLVLTSTSVFAYTFDASTQLTRRLDFDLSYSHMAIGGDYLVDSIWSNGPGTGVYSKNTKYFIPGQTRWITNEIFSNDWLSADFRYVITKPDALIDFYLGAGYMYMVMTNTQHYFQFQQDSVHYGGDQIYQKSFDRSAIKVMFGMRHDFELGSGLTLESFAQIATMAAFQGQQPEQSFMLNPDPQLLIMTHFNLGFTLYYGWWGVKRMGQ